MTSKLTERIVATCVLVYAIVLYVLTVAPTASFWDSGEFIAIANKLEVSHPPGAPVFMLIGRLFSMFVPVSLVALSVNLISVLASALTVLLTHLIIVRLVREWQAPAEASRPTVRFAALFGGVVGACTFAVTDSFWFNAVEAEVYALSMLFTAAVVWLIMLWSEKARAEEKLLGRQSSPFALAANRYLILIAYLFGLAIGVHLLNLLAIFFIALIIYFSEFDRPEFTNGKRFGHIVATGVVSSVAFCLVYPGVVQGLPGLAGSFDSLLVFAVLVVGAVTLAIWWTHSRRHAILNLAAVSIAMVLIGYASYALIFIRSAADPPIDENDPETTEAIVSYLKREQYGQTPLFSGNTYDNTTGQMTPTEVTLPRRWSQDPAHVRVYRQYGSDSEFFWKYQVGHMYLRYFLWNFAGRASDVQDAPAITGLTATEGAQYYFQTPSERASRNVYFALPLLLGLFGFLYHVKRDWRRALAVFALFFIAGIGIIVYLNQPPSQPRERDYSYVASFFAFAIWVGIGATGLIDYLASLLSRNGNGLVPFVLYPIAVLVFVAVPGLMLYQNFDDHDRSGRFVAPDYAHNMLMSVDENAVLFTNGDNDTFPLWYVQEVEGLRTDVRVANLSLLNTPWYIKQLKHQPSRESEPLPISLPDSEIDQIGVSLWNPRDVAIPVDKELIAGSGELSAAMGDTSVIESPMRWRLEGRPFPYQEPNILHAADQAALNIVMTNAQNGWQRPIYFAVTVSPDGQLDLQNYFQLEGQAFRIVPIRHNQTTLGRPHPAITPERLKSFRFRGTDNPDVYFDHNIRSMLDNYRNVFSHTAESLARDGDVEGALELLDLINERMPFDVVPGDERSFVLMARAYQAASAEGQAIDIVKRMEPLVLHQLNHASTTQEQEYFGNFIRIIQGTYLQGRDFEAAAAFSRGLGELLDDTSYVQTAEEFEALMGRPDSIPGEEVPAPGQ